MLQLLSFLLCRASMTRICGKPSNETVRSVVSHLSCCMRIWCRRILSRALSIPAFPHPQLLSSGPGALSALHTRYLITGTSSMSHTQCCVAQMWCMLHPRLFPFGPAGRSHAQSASSCDQHFRTQSVFSARRQFRFAPADALSLWHSLLFILVKRAV